MKTLIDGREALDFGGTALKQVPAIPKAIGGQ